MEIERPAHAASRQQKKAQRRTVQLQRRGDQAELTGLVLAGDTSAEACIKPLLQEELPAQAYGRLLLLPGAKPQVAVTSRGKLVCSCFNVTDAAIDAQLAATMPGTDAARFVSLQAALKAALKCGTSCGSCVPELKRQVRASRDTTPDEAPIPRTVLPIRQIA